MPACLLYTNLGDETRAVLKECRVRFFFLSSCALDGMDRGNLRCALLWDALRGLRWFVGIGVHCLVGFLPILVSYKYGIDALFCLVRLV